MAARAGNLPCLNALIRVTTELDHKDECGNTALHYACMPNRREGKYQRCIQSLFRNGAPIDPEDVTGKTPLRVCVEFSHLDAALWLLEQGADMKRTTKDGMTLLMTAVYYNRHRMLQLLFSKNGLDTWSRIGHSHNQRSESERREDKRDSAALSSSQGIWIVRLDL